jgi:hypothetical protein
MSSAHVFYIPVIFVVGLLFGYFAGRRAAETEREEKRDRLRSRRNLRETKKKDESEGNASTTAV